jgi:hypothetical protein
MYYKSTNNYYLISCKIIDDPVSGILGIDATYSNGLIERTEYFNIGENIPTILNNDGKRITLL